MSAMFRPYTWHGSPQRLIVYFVLLLFLPAGAVVWLGVRLIRQDRVLESRQPQERRESAADLVIAGLEQAISATERGLGGPPDRISLEPGDDAVLVALRNDGRIEAFPQDLLYYPAIPGEADEQIAEFAAAEQLEFRGQDYEKAGAMFSALGRSPDASVRAGALIGLARNLRKLRRTDEALRVYDDLLRLDSARIAGVPADLAGRRARCVVLRELGREYDLRNEARLLETDLLTGRWRLDRGAFLS